ncbi:MAG: hypothetical protein ICV60_16650 [Pyrinomonadaceae bacterium]|nr:hypothetical protein [Pyrinomonadaceae bacterium]
MKFFVSSRMRELFIERKTAIETIHFCGHTPLYIETEPEVKDLEALYTMNKLVSDADGFISIYYLSEGKKDKILGYRTPIEYELEQFVELKGKDAPIIFFKQTPDRFVMPSRTMEVWFEEKASELGIQPILFDGPREMDSKIQQALGRFSDKKDAVCVKDNFIIRYVGPDFIGLIGKLSEVVFTGYRLNIDYISHASGGGMATTYVSCSPRLVAGSGEEVNLGELEENMQRIIAEDFEKACTEEEHRFADGSNPQASLRPSVKVDKDPTEVRPYQLFTKVRTIDAPGQLTAICKEFLIKGFNIDEFQLRPSAPEYPRQTTMYIWLSRPAKWSKGRDEDQAELERSLRYLVGVRNFSIRVMSRP